MTPLYIFGLEALVVGELDLTPAVYVCPNDVPNYPVISTMRALIDHGADVMIWTARSADRMNETLRWLHSKAGLEGERYEGVSLCMRRTDDVWAPEADLKGMWLDDLSEFERRRLVAVFEAKNNVVAAIRLRGVACFQVGMEVARPVAEIGLEVIGP